MKYFIAMIGLTMSCSVFAQSREKFELGVGFGLDYGGIGSRITYLPTERFAAFGGLGYNLVGIGFNAGGQFRLPVSKRVTTYLTAMYGYNAAIIVKGYERTGKYTYYGPSVGLGYLWLLSKKRPLALSFEMLVPFRSQAFKNAVDDFNMLGAMTMPGYYDVGDPSPVLLSIGFHSRIHVGNQK